MFRSVGMATSINLLYDIITNEIAIKLSDVCSFVSCNTPFLFSFFYSQPSIPYGTLFWQHPLYAYGTKYLLTFYLCPIVISIIIILQLIGIIVHIIIKSSEARAVIYTCRPSSGKFNP